MIKFLFLDLRQIEQVRGFERHLTPPAIDPEPLIVSDAPWENDKLGLYGTVVRREDGLWQMWYTCRAWGPGMSLAYAESPDGHAWERPLVGLEIDGRRTNILRDDCPIGTAVLYDPDDPRPTWRYKMVTAPSPVTRICAFRSPDGIRWKPIAENPVIGTHPDGPMGLVRLHDDRYALLHRPAWGDRRVARSESWDFVHWTPARIVCEPEPYDGTNVQFYGMGTIQYGAYELGTLWVYRTDEDDMVWSKGLGVLDCELTYSRGGYAWHRTSPGTPWLGCELAGTGYGQVHTASAPLLLEDEVRFHLALSRTRHGEDRLNAESPRWSIHRASVLPDRFVGIEARAEGELLTRPFWTEHPGVHLNASVHSGGFIRAEVTDVEGHPLPGFEMEQCVPFAGDDWRHPVRWQGTTDPGLPGGTEMRLRVHAEEAMLYSIAAGSSAQTLAYDRFELPHYLPRRRALLKD